MELPLHDNWFGLRPGNQYRQWGGTGVYLRREFPVWHVWSTGPNTPYPVNRYFLRFVSACKFANVTWNNRDPPQQGSGPHDFSAGGFAA